MVRLIRSKGVGVYFVTQNPLDMPDTVLGQLGNRVQHALRAFTPRDQKAVKAAAETMRAEPGARHRDGDHRAGASARRWCPSSTRRGGRSRGARLHPAAGVADRPDHARAAAGAHRRFAGGRRLREGGRPRVGVREAEGPQRHPRAGEERAARAGADAAGARAFAPGLRSATGCRMRWAACWAAAAAAGARTRWWKPSSSRRRVRSARSVGRELIRGVLGRCSSASNLQVICEEPARDNASEKSPIAGFLLQFVNDFFHCFTAGAAPGFPGRADHCRRWRRAVFHQGNRRQADLPLSGRCRDPDRFSHAVFAAVFRRRGDLACAPLAALSGSDRLRIAFLGLLGYYLSSFLDFLGLQYISAGLERLILFLTPSFVLLISVFFLKKKIGRLEWMALLASYSGTVLVFLHDARTGGANVPLGGAFVLASAVTYALYLLMSGELVRRVGPMRLVAYAMCVSSFACILQFLAAEAARHAGAAGAGVWPVAGQRRVLHGAAGVPDHDRGGPHRRADGIADGHGRAGVDTVSGRAGAGRTDHGNPAGRHRAGAGRHLFTLEKESVGRDMDLGIKGKTALVCGASKGLGKGCAEALAAEGVNLVLVARNAEALEKTAEEIRRAHGVNVIAVAADITTPEGRAQALAACPAPDILVTNAGGPPPGDFRDWDRDDWIAALDANMLTPIELIKATVDGMSSARLRPHRQHHVERGEGADRRAGPVQRRAQRPDRLRRRRRAQDRGAQRHHQQPAARAVRHRPPAQPRMAGAAKTDRQDASSSHGGAAQADIPARRFGTPTEFGAVCAFLCSAHAGYITGQNILIDGGAYPGTF